jgi:hypothetical protein
MQRRNCRKKIHPFLKEGKKIGRRLLARLLSKR